jgi:uncharacterized protein YidB (DUF937 family)
MGLLDDAIPGGSIAKPLMVALGALLVGKMMTRSDSSAQATVPQAASQGPQAGLFGGLGGLLDRLSQAGLGSAANSWVGPGQNAPIQPEQLQSALGQTTISDLARHAGMSEQELLTHLSQALPGVVDKLTPNGRIPSQNEVQSIFGH